MCIITFDRYADGSAIREANMEWTALTHLDRCFTHAYRGPVRQNQERIKPGVLCTKTNCIMRTDLQHVDVINIVPMPCHQMQCTRPPI